MKFLKKTSCFLLVLSMLITIIPVMNASAGQNTIQTKSKEVLSKALSKLYKSNLKTKTKNWNRIMAAENEQYGEYSYFRAGFNCNWNEYDAATPVLYAYKDIDGDGVKELLTILRYPRYLACDSKFKIYKYVNGKAKLILSERCESNSFSGNTVEFYNKFKYIKVNMVDEDANTENVYLRSGSKYKLLSTIIYDDSDIKYGTWIEKGKKTSLIESEYEAKLRGILKNKVTVNFKEYGKTAKKVSANKFSKAKKGDIIKLGYYEQDNNLSNGREAIEWIVLSKSNDELFLLSKKALYDMQWDEDSWGDNETKINEWVNSNFYNAAFNDSEKAIIKSSSINKDYTEGNIKDYYSGNALVRKIFLLSIKDYDKYSGIIKKYKNKLTKFALAQSGNHDNGGWWLRTIQKAGESESPGMGNNYDKVYYITDKGKINSSSCAVNYGVRPAMVIKIK